MPPDQQLEVETPNAESPPSTEPQAGPLETSTQRFGADSHPLLVGKSPAEAIDIVNKLTMAIQYQHAASSPQPMEQQQVAQPAVQIDDNLLVTDPAEWRRQFAQSVENSVGNTLATAAAPIYNNIAATAETLSRANPQNKDVADKWWTEVQTMVAPIPAHMRSQALYDQAAKMARSNHIDEIAQERAAAIAGAGTGLEGGGVRGDGAPVKGDEATWTKIETSALGKKMVAQYGKAKVVETAKRMNLTLDKYADMISGSNTQIDPEKGGTWYTELGARK